MDNSNQLPVRLNTDSDKDIDNALKAIEQNKSFYAMEFCTKVLDLEKRIVVSCS